MVFFAGFQVPAKQADARPTAMRRAFASATLRPKLREVADVDIASAIFLR